MTRLASQSERASLMLQANPADLSPWVESFWYSHGELPFQRERVLPSATCDLVVNLGAPMRLLEGRGLVHISAGTTTGLTTRPLVIEHPRWHRAVGMRVRPLGLRRILGVPAAALLDDNAALESVLSGQADALVDKLHAAVAPRDTLQALIHWVRARVHRSDWRADAVVAWTVDTIEAAAGSLSLRALVQSSGYGETRFRERFRAELGVTPKTFARLVRFRHVLDAIGADVPLATLAVDAGYADQAHMCRDFRRLGETTPSDLLARRNPSGLTMAD